jgi:hypothetical protein
MNSDYDTATTAKASCLELSTPTLADASSSNAVIVLTTMISKNISIQQPSKIVGRTTIIKAQIQMFGGEVPKPPLVQKRKEQLSKNWENDVTKTVATHGACGRTGGNSINIADLRKVEWSTSLNLGVYRKRIAFR